jgi:hypothetical protein
MPQPTTTDDNDDGGDLLDRLTVARMLGTSPAQVTQWARLGRLRGVIRSNPGGQGGRSCGPGGGRLYPRAEVEAFRRRRAADPGDTTHAGRRAAAVRCLGDLERLSASVRQLGDAIARGASAAVVGDFAGDARAAARSLAENLAAIG